MVNLVPVNLLNSVIRDDPFCDRLFARCGIPRLFATEIQENSFKIGYLHVFIIFTVFICKMYLFVLYLFIKCLCQPPLC